MGTGVGEAMLIGAAVGGTAGGVGAAVQGGDPLEGILTGGALGAVGGGLGGAFSGGAGGALSGGTGGISTSSVPGLTSGLGVGTGGALGGTTAGTAAGTGAATGSVFGGAGGTAGGATSLGTSIGGVGGGTGTLGSTGFGIGQGANYTNFANTAMGAGTGSGGLTAASMPTLTGPTIGATGGGAGTSVSPNIFGYSPLTNTQLGMTAATAGLAGAMGAERAQFGQPNEEYTGPLSKLKYDPNRFTASTPVYAPNSVYRPTYAAEGGIMQAYQSGGPVERMTNMNTAMNPQGGLYPQGMIDKTQYATPTQRPTSMEVVESEPSYDARVNPMTGTLMAKGGIARFDMGGEALLGTPGGGSGASPQTMADQGIAALGAQNKKRMMTKEQMDAIAMQGMSKDAMQDVYGQMAAQGLAAGGHLGDYSDGGRMLKGPGDGMSDNIPATIAGKQPARLADGEFVVPADVVSHLGNGSTDAGAKQLYSMMDKVRKARTGRKAQGKQIKPAKYLAA